MASNARSPLQGKTAIITGVGDRGQLGYAIAQQLLAAGARVCVTSRHDDIGAIAGTLAPDAVGVQYDLASEDDVARLMTTAQQQLGRIDILVNVAGGLSVIKPLAETTREEWQREVQRNAETAFLVSRAALPQLRASRGCIINFASPAGEKAVAQLGAYSAAKAGVIALTRAMAIEEAGNGVRVNAIAPGMIDTAQNRAAVADPDAVQWVSRAEVASVVVFLASAAAAAITGQTINVPGKGIT
ncbi:MAG TPA: SDR family oxidoreductase [Longimicrobiales bacterium]